MIKTINVTASDIARGKARECDTCPVARAIRRVAKGYAGVVVTKWSAWLCEKPGDEAGKRLDLPRAAQVFIHLFDTSQPVIPFKFTLDIPEAR
jgi:hypothetical protein